MITHVDIVNAYFGGSEFVPEKLSEEGMQCFSKEDEYKLAENMELYYRDTVESVEDDELASKIHRNLCDWIHEHNF